MFRVIATNIERTKNGVSRKNILISTATKEFSETIVHYFQ